MQYLLNLSHGIVIMFLIVVAQRDLKLYKRVSVVIGGPV